MFGEIHIQVHGINGRIVGEMGAGFDDISGQISEIKGGFGTVEGEMGTIGQPIMAQCAASLGGSGAVGDRHIPCFTAEG